MSLCSCVPGHCKGPTGFVRYSVNSDEGGYLTKHTQDFKCRLDDHRISNPFGVICSTSLELCDDLQGNKVEFQSHMKDLKHLTSGIKICLPMVPQCKYNKPEYVTKRKTCN